MRKTDMLSLEKAIAEIDPHNLPIVPCMVFWDHTEGAMFNQVAIAELEGQARNGCIAARWAIEMIDKLCEVWTKDNNKLHEIEMIIRS